MSKKYPLALSTGKMSRTIGDDGRTGAPASPRRSGVGAAGALAGVAAGGWASSWGGGLGGEGAAGAPARGARVRDGGVAALREDRVVVLDHAEAGDLARHQALEEAEGQHLAAGGGVIVLDNHVAHALR